VPFHRTTDLGINHEPVSVIQNRAEPAGSDTGDIDDNAGRGTVTVKVAAPLVPPPGEGVATLIEADPILPVSAAGINASIELLERTAVVSAVPFQQTTDDDAKLDPLTTRANLPEPAATDAGLIVDNTGTGWGFDAVIVKLVAELVPPPGPGVFTTTEAVPPVATSDAGTTAVSSDDDTYVVASAAAFHSTTDAAAKLDPLTVSSNCCDPAAIDVGPIDASTGAGLDISTVVLTANASWVCHSAQSASMVDSESVLISGVVAQ
jgi:hypothetical protein